MGNTGFWIDSIIDKRKILPTHADFCNKPEICKQLCPLIWNSKKKTMEKNPGGFINGDLTAKFFNLLIKNSFPGSENNSDDLRESILKCLKEENHADKEEILVFEELMNNDFIRKLIHFNLYFGKSKQYVPTQKDEVSEEQKQVGDFTYDVVLTLDDLGKSLGVITSWMVELDDLIQSKVEEKLGLHTYQELTKPRPFRLWIVFNAREQKFQVVKGITVEILRELITVKPNAPSQACALARAHIQNAFSMCNPDGTDPRPIDFDRFQGSFTPEFYPRRFALKDSIYSQRLDVLASLLVHILRRYQCCLPPVRYCELSVGVGDICRPWVFDILSSFPAHQSIAKESLKPSNFCNMIVKEGRFPHLRSACSTKEDSSNFCNRIDKEGFCLHLCSACSIKEDSLTPSNFCTVIVEEGLCPHLCSACSTNQVSPMPSNFSTMIVKKGRCLHLCSACSTKQVSLTPSNVCNMIVKEGCCPHLCNACSTEQRKLPCILNVTYKFLAGFNRQSVRAHRLSNQPEAIRLLNDSPDVAIHYMLQEIVQSVKQEIQAMQETQKMPSTPPQENNLVCKF